MLETTVSEILIFFSVWFFCCCFEEQVLKNALVSIKKY